MDKHLFIEWITVHWGKILGATAGLAIGLAVIYFGILKTLFVAICIFLGYLAGKQLDDRVDIREKILSLLGER